MFYFLLKKEYLGVLVLLFATGALFYFRTEISESALSYFLERKFTYTEPAFLKLMLLLVAFVSIGLFAGLDRNEKLDIQEKVKASSSYMLLILSFGIVFWGLHLYFVYDTMANSKSMMALEQHWLKYYLSDIGVVLGFVLGGLLFLRKAIHHNTDDI